MGIDCELSNTTSYELALAIRQEMNNEKHPQPPTLGSMLVSMRQGLYEELVRSNRITVNQENSVIQELERLIEDYGDEMPAEDFVDYSASDDLSAVAHNLLNSQTTTQPPTLTTLRNAITNGLCTQLVANGEIAMDDEHSLITEINELIQLHGEDTPAELFVR